MRRDIFHAIADPTRRSILILLASQAMTPNGIAEHFDTTRQAVSKHLHVLSGAGIIDGSYQGREHVWSVNADRLEDGRRHIDLIARKWDDALARFKAYVESVD